MSESLAEVSLEGGPKQPYHLVKPSPWPIVISLFAGTMMTGAIMWMHGGVHWLFPLGLALVIATMAIWWRDIIHESVVEKAHSAAVKVGLRYGMALFISSEVMFFVAFF